MFSTRVDVCKQRETEGPALPEMSGPHMASAQAQFFRAFALSNDRDCVQSLLQLARVEGSGERRALAMSRKHDRQSVLPACAPGTPGVRRPSSSRMAGSASRSPRATFSVSLWLGGIRLGTWCRGTPRPQALQTSRIN